MGGTYIGTNIKKQSERIDPTGNIINPRTKEIVKPAEPVFTPPVVQQEVKQETNNMADKINKMVEARIAEKIDAIVAQRVNDALKNL